MVRRLKSDLHAALFLGVGPAELGLIQAIDAIAAVLLYEAACADPTAPGADSSG